MNFKRIVNIDFRRCGISLWKHRYFVIAMGILGTIIGVLFTIFVVPKENKYTATASVYCVSYGSLTESVDGTSVMRTYSSIIKSHRVTEHAAMLIADPEITGEDIYEEIEVDPLVVRGTTYVYETDTPIISMHAVHEDENHAVSVVNAVADAFVQEINSMSDIMAIQVLDYAYDGTLTYNAMQTCFLVVILLTLLGIFLGCLIILFRVVFTDRVLSVTDAGLFGQMDVVGIIPEFDSARRT